MFVGSDALALAPLTRRIAYLEDGDWAVVTARRRHDLRPRAARRRARGQARPRCPARSIGKGNYPPLHGEGDPRAAGGDRRHAARADQPGDARGASAEPAVRPRQDRRDHDHRLRHRVLCRAGRQILVRAAGADAGRGRRRLGVPLPRGRHAAGRAWRSSSRNRARPPTRWRRCAMPRSRGSTCWPSSTCRKARWRARPTPCCATLAGPEIGVASTKAFTTQLAVLACLAIALARARGAIDRGARGAR